jgi:hypothetical protein
MTMLDLVHCNICNTMQTPMSSKQATQEISDACVASKQLKEAFKDGKPWRANTTLDLVHCDICSAMQTPTVSSVRYFLLFVDDFSWRMWV